MTSEAGAPVLLYDGTCGLCDATVRFVLERDPSGQLRFASLQSAFAQSVLAAHPELQSVDSMVWVDPGSGLVLTKSAAAIRVAWYLGGWWRLAEVFRLVPRPIRDAMYDVIARHRHRLMGSAEPCFVHPPDVRHRFLDLD